ncbi:uncharacterized protein [Gossypium hirsutum]|uniref:Retrotransposon gag domain-containing protein n=1 Tax=Gossypium hirsutum TaxID=3635 RepID=A0A1U8PVZ4_GOSHI|nr:uncharacterized protein LOC107963279 [Gossypium hirsutum]
MKQYGHVTDIAPDRIMLQNMEKKSNESFNQYAQRWREVATQVQPPLLEKETTMLFINTLKVPFINHILGSATKSFANIVMSGEMIENAIRCGKIETGESTKRSTPKKRENEVSNVSTSYEKPITVNQPRTVAMGQQASPRQEPNTKQNTEKLQFTLISITYRELYKSLFNAHVVSPFYLKSMQPPYPKWYDASAQCEYHVGITGHSIENCTSFKSRKYREENQVECCRSKNPVERGLKENSGKRVNHAGFGEQILRCEELLRRCIHLRGGSIEKVSKVNHPVVIISRPKINEAGAKMTPRIVIQKSVAFPYNSKMVHWNYNCNVTSSGEEIPVSTPNTKAEPVKEKSLVIEKGKENPKSLINEPVTEKEAKEFLKFLKHNEYNVVEQLHKQLVHRNALMKVLNETYVTDDILVNKLDLFVNNINADNFISFSDDEIPSKGMRSTKSLHITTRCKGYTLPEVLTDNGSTLNVLPLSILNRLPIDSSHMKTCQNIVRAFDGTERKIHSAGVVPSSLHQKLKLVTESRLITISAEEDIIASVTGDGPYIENDSEAIECSFWSLEFVNATFIIEEGKVPMLKISEATRMSLQLTVGKRALIGRELEKYLHG